MNEAELDKLIEREGRSYNDPPAPPLDAMWSVIAAQDWTRASDADREAGAPAGADAARRRIRRWVMDRRFQAAAVLLIGVGIGRLPVWHSIGTNPLAVATRNAARGNTVARADTALAGPYQVATSRYLGQTAALLIALPADSHHMSAVENQQFIARAGDLLTTTRLLLDSPAADTPSMRNLLEDLELVLAQVVRLRDAPSRTELDLIHQALDQREVLPRLTTAAADISAN
jgi:hypothetical protein